MWWWTSQTLAQINAGLLCATLFCLQWPTSSFYCILESCYGDQVNTAAASFKSLLHNTPTGHSVILCIKAADGRDCWDDDPPKICPHAQIKCWQRAQIHSSAVQIVHIVMRWPCSVQSFPLQRHCGSYVSQCAQSGTSLICCEEDEFPYTRRGKPHKWILNLLIPEWHLVFHITFSVGLTDHIIVLLSLPTLTDRILNVWRCEFAHFWFGIPLKVVCVTRLHRRSVCFIRNHGKLKITVRKQRKGNITSLIRSTNHSVRDRPQPVTTSFSDTSKVI